VFAPLIALAAATAPVASADLAGIWEGTIGNLPVRACLAPREWGPLGSYYYLSRGRLIALDAEPGTSGTYHENDVRDPDAPRWTIETANAGRLTARWAHGGRTLPVRLLRIAPASDGQDHCSGMEYHRPRLAGIRTVTARASLDGVNYSRTTLNHGGRFEASVEIFALDGSGAAVDRLNATLRQSLTGSPPEWFECIRAALERFPSEGSFDQRLAPTLISRRWMGVVEQYDNFCGGNHPNHGRRYRTFDLASGEEVDLHDWLNASAVKRHRWEPDEEDIKTLQPEFRDFILAGWTAEDPDCAESVRSHEFWNIGLTRNGLIFSPDLPHVAQACGEQFALTFARLRPFMTEEGAANLRALQTEAVARVP
jgi:hypothetical protein